MGGSDEAVRHLLELVLSCLLPLANLCRAFAGYVAEDSPERAKAVPAGLEGHVDDRSIRVTK